jgi:hypothetical protein
MPIKLSLRVKRIDSIIDVRLEKNGFFMKKAIQKKENIISS